MRTSIAATAIAVCFLGPGRAGAEAPEVVTTSSPALSATMQLVGQFDGCSHWLVTGKVKAAYRGHFGNVSLACMRNDCLLSGCPGEVTLRFPPERATIPGPPGTVDGCGNFAFAVQSCGGAPQLDSSYVCMFAVQVDGDSAPQSCGNNNPPPGPVEDLNGTAPCSGGFCPTAP